MYKFYFFLISLLPTSIFCQIAQPGRPLFDPKTVGEIRLTISTKNWGDALDSMRLYGDGMLSGTAKVDGATYENVGIRYRGNNSYQMGVKRNPFQIKLNAGDSAVNHQGFSNLKLSSALRDPSMVREMLFYEIAGKYVAAPQASYTTLYVNDEYLGVYVNVESVDADFCKKHIGASENAFFKAGVEYQSESPKGCRAKIFGALEYEQNLECYRYNFEGDADAKWSDLQEMTRILNKDPKNLESVLDVDATLWFLALNNSMVNLNSYLGNYSQNYYLYKDSRGRFQPISWDLNLAFGSFKSIGAGNDLELKDLQRLDPMLHADNVLKPLVSQILKDPTYKKIYLSHLRQIMAENFDNGWYEKRAAELQGLIIVPYSNDQTKQYSLDEFQTSLKTTIGKRSKIPGIVELMEKRSKFLKNHPDLTALPAEITNVLVAGRGKFEAQKVNTFNITAQANRFPKRLSIYYRFDQNQSYQMLPMNEDAGGDLPTGAKMFSAAIDGKSENDVLDYYIVAETAGSISFSPSNYTTKPYKVKLSDLNK